MTNLLHAAVLATLFVLLPADALGETEPAPPPPPAAPAVAVPVAPPAPVPAATTELAPSTAAQDLEGRLEEEVQGHIARIEVSDDDEEALSPALLEKLDGAQITEILTKREEARSASGAEDVVVPVTFFLLLALVIALPLVLRSRQARRREETLRAIVERGGTIPPELLAPPTPPRSDLRRGVLFSALGLGSGLFFLFVASEEPAVASLGLIPLLIGLGYLLVWRIEGRRNALPPAP